MNQEERDREFMSLALAEAEKGLGRVSPNPLVGAVLVRGARVIARGAHLAFGGPHAEIHALQRAGARARGSTLYVTLEPCSTFGKTPPCTEAIARAGVRRVVAASEDPNPKHRGRGIAWLRRKGIEMAVGCLEAQARELNTGFFTWVTRRRPFVSLKLAETLDGKIATRTGDSRWVSSEASRRIVQEMRRRADAILVGSETVLRDNPRLTVRAARRQPAVVILDVRARVPLSARVLADRSRVRLVVTGRLRPRLRNRYLGKGIDVLEIARGGRVALKGLLGILGELGVTSLLVEGGGETAACFLEERCADRVLFFIAPKVAGGRDAKTSVEGLGCARMSESLALRSLHLAVAGPDLVVWGEPSWSAWPSNGGEPPYLDRKKVLGAWQGGRFEQVSAG